MSLINDALKRASQTDKSRARPPEAPAGMTPAPARRAPKSPVALGAGILVVGALAVLCLWRAFFGGHESMVKLSPPAVAVSPPPQAAPTPAPAIVTPPPIQPAPAAIAPAPIAAAAAPETKAPLPPPSPVPTLEPWPVLKLQGILYSRANPTAMINGHAVGVGDEVAGTRVKKIDRDKVIMEWNGRTNVIFFGNY